MRIRVKVCGITRAEDAQRASELGVDAVGLVFHPPSPRAVSISRAAAIVAALPSFTSVVALFVNPSAQMVRDVLRAVPVDLLQFHGEEDPSFCQGFGRRYIKALPVKPGIDLRALAERYRDASGLLLDAFREGFAGGTGATFDWALVPKGLRTPLVLAGGLNPANVAMAIREVNPYAVDVSSGVERAKGIKDPARMGAFIQQVHEASRDL